MTGKQRGGRAGRVRAMACAGALAWPVFACGQATVVLYGIADGDLRFDHTSIGTLRSVGSGGEQATRFGLRGAEDLGGGLKALFNFEQDFDLSDNSVPQGEITPTTKSSPVSSSGSRIFGRRAVVGLDSASWGEVLFGRDRTPMYRAYLAADPWEVGTLGSALNYSIGSTSRFDNAVGWTSPDVGGLQFAAQYRAGEATTRTVAAGGPLDGGDALSGSLTYKAGPLYLEGSYLQTRPSGTTNLTIAKSGNVGATYDLAFVKLHALAFFTTNYAQARYFAYAAGATVPLRAFKIIVVGARIDNRNTRRPDADASPSHFDDANFYSVGGTYSLSKRTDLYLVGARFVNQGAATFVLRDNSDNGLFTTANVPPGFNPWSVQTGIRTNF